MKRICEIASLLGSLICAAGTLGTAVPTLHAQTSAKIEAWRELMMQPRTKTAGCYTANYPSTQWTTEQCSAAPALVKRQVEPQVTTAIHASDESTSSDYVALSMGTISSATGTLTIANNNSADGFGFVPNEFSIQLNTMPFASADPNCNANAGCLGWVQFMIDSGGSIQMQDWLLGYTANAANTACPAGYALYPNSQNCIANFGYMRLPVVPPFLAYSGVKLTGDTSGGLDSVTIFLPGGLLMQGVISDSEVGLDGKWPVAEFNVLGNSGGDETVFNPGTYVDVQLALTDGTASAPHCLGGTYAAESTNLVLGACTASATPSPGIQFEEAAPPVITGVTPNFGPRSGGTPVNLLGQGFNQTMQAQVGSTFVTLTGCTSTNCTLVTPPGEGMEQISVSNLGIEGTALAPSEETTQTEFNYEYLPYGSMQPSVGTSSTTVTISGAGFDTAPNAVLVTFLLEGVAVPGTGVVCSSTTVCTMHPPAKPSSVTGGLTVPVTMTVDGKATSIGNFAYPAPPIKPPTPPCGRICI